MFDDRDVGSEQAVVGRTGGVGRVVDVKESLIN
jgi:hypothetical protein